MWTWEALFAWTLCVTPVIAIVPVDIDSLEGLVIAGDSKLSLESSISILSLKEELSSLKVMLIDSI
jgi:ABC-type transporter Mla maintaining outer membrane lipid asymmetry permease subunit MlaE